MQEKLKCRYSYFSVFQSQSPQGKVNAFQNQFYKTQSYVTKEFCFEAQHQGGNSQNFLGKFVRFIVTLRCFYVTVIH